ncbi:MAG: HD domain-containing protein [Candidatus Nanoarchaeia archaeon]
MGKQRNYELSDEILKASQRDSPTLPYHNFEHEMRVRSAAATLARYEGVSAKSAYLIDTAAALHDVIMIPGAKDNEERAADYAGALLQGKGYSKKDIANVQRIILATKMPTNPKSIDEMIIADADVENLGTDDFIKYSRFIAEEAGRAYDSSWIKGLIGFLDNHRYYTNAAKTLWEAKKQQNLGKLYLMYEQAQLEELKNYRDDDSLAFLVYGNKD